MHRELKRLSCAESVDARATVRRVVSRLPEAFPLRSHPAVAEAFAAEVERSLESGVLRYSVRARLLREARQRGLGRFEANLIIAAVQHRRSMQPLDTKGFGCATDDARAHWWQPVATFLLAQGLILLTAWWVLLR